MLGILTNSPCTNCPTGSPKMDRALTAEELAALPHDDRGPAIVAVHWSMTSLATMFLGLRLYCKTLTKRRLWWDDWLLILAWVRCPDPANCGFAHQNPPLTYPANSSPLSQPISSLKSSLTSSS